MLKMKTIGTGSSGNSYILETENEALVIDAGCKTSLVKEALEYDILKIKGLLVSHEHG